MLAGLLFMGNVMFVEVDTAEGSIADVQNMQPLEISAELLGVDAMLLKNAMTDRVITTRGEEFIIKMNVKVCMVEYIHTIL